MKLYIIRHAAAEQRNYDKDFYRVLRDKGEKQLAKMTRFMLHHPSENRMVLSSSSQRTKQTYEGIRSVFESDAVSFHKELYHAYLQDLLDFIWNTNIQNTDLVIIGHNPGLSALATYFSGNEILLQTGGIVVLDFPIDSPAEMSMDCGTIIGKFRAH